MSEPRGSVRSYGVFGLPPLLPRGSVLLRRFSSGSLRDGTPLHWMMGGSASRGVWPTQQGTSLFILLAREPPPGVFILPIDRATRLYRGASTNSSAITWRRRVSSWVCRRRNFTPNSWPLAHRTVASSTLICTAFRDP